MLAKVLNQTFIGKSGLYSNLLQKRCAKSIASSFTENSWFYSKLLQKRCAKSIASSFTENSRFYSKLLQKSLRQVVCGKEQLCIRKGEIMAWAWEGENNWFVQFMVDFTIDRFVLHGVMGTLFLPRSTSVGPSCSAHESIIIAQKNLHRHMVQVSPISNLWTKQLS